MTQLDDDLARLVHEDPLHPAAADTARVIRAGARLRRRRRLAVSVGAGLAAAAVVAPFIVLGGSDDASVGIAQADQPRLSTSTPVAPDPDTATLTPLDELLSKGPQAPSVCGVMACRPKRGQLGSPEEGSEIGSRLEMGTFDGHTEVLYAAHNEGFDTSTGEPMDKVAVLSSGIVIDGQLRRTVWAFQPHEDRLGPIRVYGGERTVDASGHAHFGVIGYVEGEHTEVTATSGGQTRTLSGVSTDVLPGYTVFYDSAPWDDSWQDRADVTYAVPGVASCSVLECGTVG